MRTRTVRLYTAMVAATLSVLTVGVPLAASAQAAYPVVTVKQTRGIGASAWGNSARVELDRDAFLVVFEFGADNRARIVFPEQPRQLPFMKGKKPTYVPLPSADAMFINAALVRVPTLVAFASDVAPDLSTFHSGGRDWDYVYAISDRTTREETLSALAELMFGDPDMPYAVAESRIAPLLPLAVVSALQRCGYQLSSMMSEDFNMFLWDMYGPIALQRLGAVGANGPLWIGTEMYGSLGSGFFNLFSRSTTGALWARYGGCGGVQQQGYFIALRPPIMNPPVDSTGLVPPPANVPGRGPHGEVEDVGIVRTSPAAMQGRKSAVETATGRAETATTASGPLTRERDNELIQRSQVAAFIADLAARRQMGVGDLADVGRRAGGGFTPSGTGGFGTPTRRGSASDGFGGGASSSSGGASSSAGSASSAGTSRGTETRASGTSTGRGGTGRPPGGDPPMM